MRSTRPSRSTVRSTAPRRPKRSPGPARERVAGAGGEARAPGLLLGLGRPRGRWGRGAAAAAGGPGFPGAVPGGRAFQRRRAQPRGRAARPGRSSALPPPPRAPRARHVRRPDPGAGLPPPWRPRSPPTPRARRSARAVPCPEPPADSALSGCGGDHGLSGEAALRILG